jgi:hypothetical protein
LASGTVLHRARPEPWRIVGPYYAHAGAVVPVSEDVFVVFGSATDGIATVGDDQLVELGRFASEALVEVTPANKLADELEALTAVQDLLHAPWIPSTTACSGSSTTREPRCPAIAESDTCATASLSQSPTSPVALR